MRTDTDKAFRIFFCEKRLKNHIKRYVLKTLISPVIMASVLRAGRFSIPSKGNRSFFLTNYIHYHFHYPTNALNYTNLEVKIYAV
jgi:hypothetical protein